MFSVVLVWSERLGITLSMGRWWEFATRHSWQFQLFTTTPRNLTLAKMASKSNRKERRPLLRVRTGCLACRARKKKCDEGKPICKGCTRNGLHCQWPGNILGEQSKDDRSPRKSSSPALSATDGFSSLSESHPIEDQATTELGYGRDRSPPLALCSDADFCPLDPEYFKEEGFSALDSTRALIDSGEGGLGFEEAASVESPLWLVRTSLTKLNGMIPAHLQFIPQLDHDRFELFGHYIQTTANSMSNGSTSSNPFLVQLLPLAVSSNLVLESILVQSCAHRAVRTPVTIGPDVLILYNKSLRSLRSAIDNNAAHGKEDLLSLIASMLILCFTEVST